MKIYTFKNKERELKVVFIVLFILEIIACYYAYYTLGEVKQMFLYFILFLNIIPIILFFFKLKTPSLIVGGIIALLLIPNQVLLLSKWSYLKKESLEIHAYICQYKKLNDKFPDDIKAYEFKNKKLAKHFFYDKKDVDNFGLQYHIGTKGTNHFYNHKHGKWSYYPD